MAWCRTTHPATPASFVVTLTTHSREDSAMTMIIDYRSTDNALVDTIWHGRSEGDGASISSSAPYWELVVTQPGDGARIVTLHGPETRPSRLTYRTGSLRWGIRFRIGTYLRHLPTQALVDRGMILPVVNEQSFLLHGMEFSIPGETAETTIQQLIQAGILLVDPVIDVAWRESATTVSARTLQRRFRQVTGINQRMARQMCRAHSALSLLEQGTSILDTVGELGYSDQAHLTRSLQRWMGQTPGRVAQKHQAPGMA